MDATIIITTFRRPAMLADLIVALHPQLVGRSVEVIVVDNCPDGSARSVISDAVPQIRYVHEAQSGVVHARNRGVNEAIGAYVIFLDDDEVPQAGWLDAWLRQADGVTDMSFGRIVPRHLAPCPLPLVGQIDRLFSRELEGPTGTDISNEWAYLGTGNAMFSRARSLPDADPFDIRFNARGGEDIWLIRSLMEQGQRLLWNREALVDELVPQNRMTLAFLKARKYNHGQLRCILIYGQGGVPATAKMILWMAVGLVQFLVFGIAAYACRVLAPHKMPDFLCRAWGGAGKLMWWHTPRVQHYVSN
jgi:succinoglycan biosynthesis protein ExoM